jgi:nitrogen fixation/metabolism regulation signal transduction histidine kinase
MKPIISSREDSGTLQDLGRASVQIVHDLKNQLNGLKLYATFLRKRLERSERPEDEQETVNKLITGLDRAANDLSTIVQYGREIELKTQHGLDLQKVLRGICTELNLEAAFEPEGANLIGAFDPTRLTEALKWISVGALKYQAENGDSTSLRLSALRTASEGLPSAIVQWNGTREWDHDPFHSFVGSDEIRMSLAAKIIRAHGGSASYEGRSLVVTLPLVSQ